MATMRAVMALRPGVLGLGELSIPQPGEYEALAGMDACAICNSTDHKLLTNEFFPGPFPVALGHEAVGTVMEVGPRVGSYRVGDRVFRQKLADAHVPGEGRSCWGGFAEYGIVTDRWAQEGIPCSQDALPHDQQKLLVDVAPALAAGMVTLMETLDCVTACGTGPGKSAAVVGSGPVGQAFAMFAKLLGAGPVYAFGRGARSAGRFATVTHCDGYVAGADYPAEVRRLLGGGGFDLVFEAVGAADALETCLTLAGGRGQVFVYGVAPASHPHGPELMARPNVRAVGAVEGRAQARLVEMIDAGGVRLEDWISHTLPLAEYQQGFDLIARKEALKVALVP